MVIRTPSEQAFWDSFALAEFDRLRKKDGKRDVVCLIHLAADRATQAVDERRRSMNAPKK